MGRRQRFLAANPRAASLLAIIKPYLPPLNFITIHYTYFISVCLIGSLIFWLSSPVVAPDPSSTSTPSGDRAITYVDSLFLVVSAMTLAGLNTVNLSEMNTWQQALLLIIIMLGSTIWVSIWTVLARKHVFEKRFEEIVQGIRLKRMMRHRRTEPVGHDGMRVFSWRRSHDDEEKRIGGGRGVLDGISEGGGGSGSDTAVEKSAGATPDGDGGDPEKPKATTSHRPLLHRTSSLPDLEHAALHHGHDNVDPLSGPHVGDGHEAGKHIAFASSCEDAAHQHPPTQHIPGTIAATSAYEHHPPPSGTATTRRRHHTTHDDSSAPPPVAPPPRPSFLRQGNNVTRNAAFYNLTDDERDAIGGCEYRALTLLLWTVSLYFILFQALGGIAVGAWISTYAPSLARMNGSNPWWAGIYYGVSAFNNSGMSLLDANMVPFQQSAFVLLVVGFLILAGNTAFPIFLRVILWGMLKVAEAVDAWFLEGKKGGALEEWGKEVDEFKATLEFILKYPRRVYTNLFPARATWWLFFMLIWLNGVDWVAFIVLNIGNKALETIPAGYRALCGLFQALAVRSGGFFVVPITDLYIGTQVLYAIMMYISVYPVVITMRHSNVYEERSLGIYAEDDDSDDESPNPNNPETSTPAAAPPPTEKTPPKPAKAIAAEATKTAAVTLGNVLKRTLTGFNGVGAIRPPPKLPKTSATLPIISSTAAAAATGSPAFVASTSGPAAPDSRVSFIRQQVRGQLAHDIWWLVAAVFIIITLETSNFLDDPIGFSAFNIFFEVISAYGCVGISVGAPGKAVSFAGAWGIASKLVLCAVMIRGRHRGLPVALDRAVRLPGEKLLREEEEDWRIRKGEIRRRRRRASMGGVYM